jgi:hypothetical protein
MDLARGHDGDRPPPAFGALARLNDVRAELAELEVLDRQVADLTALLRGRLAPEEFRLVWALRDAVECRAVAEALLHDRRRAGRSARELPADPAALRALRRDLLGDEHPDDATG